MPEFLTTRGITARVESTITNSTKFLFILSPYLNYVQQDFLNRIQRAIDRGVDTTLVYRNIDNIHQNELEKLDRISGLTVLQNEDLHAKAYLNEEEAVVTSFNLSGYSEANNIEFGIYFTLLDSKKMFSSLLEETKNVIDSSHPPVFLGFCIRCHVSVSLDPNKPLCYNCYTHWAKHKNANYPERFCHFCGGTSSHVSVQVPICERCDR